MSVALFGATFSQLREMLDDRGVNAFDGAVRPVPNNARQ